MGSVLELHVVELQMRTLKTGLGLQGALGHAREERLIKQIQRLEAAVFALNKQTV
jgi:hypothetical protein